MTPPAKTIYTIGHSTHSLETFLKMLQSFNIELIADVRSLPGSRKFPQYDKESLAVSLPENNIAYTHLADLGGRRKTKKDSKNTRWRNDSFRGYADYMETEAFKKAAAHLEDLATTQATAVMCAEAVWWRCHRSMISDYLMAKGWTVLHIMAEGKSQVHSYTQPAIVADGTVCYAEDANDAPLHTD